MEHIGQPLGLLKEMARSWSRPADSRPVLMAPTQSPLCAHRPWMKTNDLFTPPL